MKNVDLINEYNKLTEKLKERILYDFNLNKYDNRIKDIYYLCTYEYINNYIIYIEINNVNRYNHMCFTVYFENGESVDLPMFFLDDSDDSFKSELENFNNLKEN